MNHLRWMTAVLAAPLALALLAGCGNNGTAAERPMATVNPEPRDTAGVDEDERENMPAAVVMTTNELNFQPRTVIIETGETVQWRNPSERVHTVTANASLANDPDHVRLPEGAERFHSGEIEPGATYEHRFEVPGEYRYVCLPHEEEGMLGRVIVEPANSDDDIAAVE